MRKLLASILQKQAYRYIRKNRFTVIAVVGSVGKTSTTQAIAQILSESFQVRTTIKNYNSDIGVPCSIFGRYIPSGLKNPFSWAWLLLRNTASLFRKPNFSILVLELGTDKPGEIEAFNWLRPDIAVVTAVAQEHMEFFETLEAVAKEELSVASYSSKVLINRNMVAQDYISYIDNEELFNYSREDIEHIGLKPRDLSIVGEHSIDTVAAGIAVGKELGMSKLELSSGAKKVRPQKGRMNPLKGIRGSLLIDDTYNASPDAYQAALAYVYAQKAPQRIVLLGNMNELGKSSKDAHRILGEMCDPKKLDMVVTLGPDANHHTADTARKRGCNVVATQTPYEAAEVIEKALKDDALVLLKGSQNGVFAEEAVKLLLANPEDAQLLVRQEKNWLKKKQESFKYEKN